MHEMGLALQIVEITKASLPPELAGARIQRVNLKVGQMAAVVPESLRFCFEAITRNTPLEGAELCMQAVAVVARCRACGHEWTLEEPVFRCPACDSGDVEVLSGRELDIVSIEVEND
ncbi:MAG TPA: hydrogenase maturation nickel metallochaperone HypA [Desulfobacterales bacterium]|jgi:hydrogenase nickel incorporation protein HypA/HybF|nr:hydrogenase maturation nickel metallochaperone HypA [Desulfobacterales bacterium]